MSVQNFDFINPIVQVDSGKIRGKLCEDVRGGKFYSFLGIPYAKPPIGNLRFKAPVPVDSWPGIFEALEEGNVSVQPNYITKQIEGSEDCLNLNVHTPCLPNLHCSRAALRPVMVFVHGGSFLTGSNRRDLHGPEILISENVVIVEINYRLGILGENWVSILGSVGEFSIFKIVGVCVLCAQNFTPVMNILKHFR